MVVYKAAPSSACVMLWIRRSFSGIKIPPDISSACFRHQQDAHGKIHVIASWKEWPVLGHCLLHQGQSGRQWQDNQAAISSQDCRQDCLQLKDSIFCDWQDQFERLLLTDFNCLACILCIRPPFTETQWAKCRAHHRRRKQEERGREAHQGRQPSCIHPWAPAGPPAEHPGVQLIGIQKRCLPGCW